MSLNLGRLFWSTTDSPALAQLHSFGTWELWIQKTLCKSFWLKNVADKYSMYWNWKQLKAHIWKDWVMGRSRNVWKWKKINDLAEHFLRLLLRCWLCVKMWRMWWVRFVHSKDDLVGTCILSNHLSHLVMFCRPAVCERHQEGWVQMPAVARYLFPLQSLQNQGGTLLLEDEMEEGHCLQYKRLFFAKFWLRLQYDDYLTFCKICQLFFRLGQSLS